jgi:hypothetical protein
MTELRADTARTIDATQEGLDRSLKHHETRMKAVETRLEAVEGKLAWIFFIAFGIVFLGSIHGFLNAAQRFFGGGA